MTNTHTPGPWRVITRERSSKPDRFGRTTETRESFINGADGLGSIAKLYIGHDQDARLIAAAPELLAALELIANHTTSANAAAQQCVTVARAAIAKVTAKE